MFDENVKGEEIFNAIKKGGEDLTEWLDNEFKNYSNDLTGAMDFLGDYGKYPYYFADGIESTDEDKKYVENFQNFVNKHGDDINIETAGKGLKKINKALHDKGQDFDEWLNGIFEQINNSSDFKYKEELEKEKNEGAIWIDQHNIFENAFWSRYKIKNDTSPFCLSLVMTDQGLAVVLTIWNSKNKRFSRKARQRLISQAKGLYDEDNKRFKKGYYVTTHSDEKNYSEEDEQWDPSKKDVSITIFATDTEKGKESLFTKDYNQEIITKRIEDLYGIYKEIADCNVIGKKIEDNISIDYKQLVLTGAPGTGKTFCAQEYAKRWNLDEDGKQITDKKKKRYDLVQFHPSYDYTDFVEGLRPVQIEKTDGEKDVTFVKVDGQFKAFCRRVVDMQLEELEKDLEKAKNEYKSAKGEEFEDNKIEGWYKKILKSDKEVIVFNEEIGDSVDKNKVKKLLTIVDKDEKKFFNKDKKNLHKKIIRIANDKANGEKIETDDKAFLDLFNGIDKDEYTDLYFFIIDEINRADISKVLGELMYLLEYRGIENRLPTQYQNLKTYDVEESDYSTFDCFDDGFYIPQNVIIVGTMNDIDKSVESFDFALRRRFKWPEIKVDQDLLKVTFRSMLNVNSDKRVKEVEKLAENIVKMNEYMCESTGLSDEYNIGPALFKDYKFKDNSLKSVFDNSIAPTIREYLRGRKNIGNVEDDVIKPCYEKLSDGIKEIHDSKEDTEEVKE